MITTIAFILFSLLSALLLHSSTVDAICNKLRGRPITAGQTLLTLICVGVWAWLLTELVR